MKNLIHERICVSIVVVVALSSLDLVAQKSSFEKTRLTDVFYAEGAYAADLTGDEVNDIIYGPYYWIGPDYKQIKSWNSMGAYDPEIYSDNFFPYARDFNKDGWEDIFMIGFPGKSARIFLNPGEKAEMWDMHHVAPEVSNESPMWKDIDGDGEPEIVCIADSTWGYYKADYSKPLEPWTFHKISPRGKWFHYTHGLGVGDVNGDDRMDVLEAEGWWEQPSSLKGDPVWEKHDYDFAKGGSQMYAYDFDQDGDNDVLTANYAHGWGVLIYENLDGKGKDFKKHVLVGGGGEFESPNGVEFSQPHGVDLVDMNGDGLLDVISGKRFMAHGTWGDPDNAGAAVTYWFETSGKGFDLKPHLIDDDTGVGVEVKALDVDKDGKMDVLVGNKKGLTLLRRK